MNNFGVFINLQVGGKELWPSTNMARANILSCSIYHEGEYKKNIHISKGFFEF